MLLLRYNPVGLNRLGCVGIDAEGLVVAQKLSISFRDCAGSIHLDKYAVVWEQLKNPSRSVPPLGCFPMLVLNVDSVLG